MALDMVLDATAAKSIEFVDETTFGTFPTNPTMLGFGGYVTKASIKETTVTEKIPYLLDASGTNHLQATKTVKVSEAFEVSLEIHPTDWSMLPRALMAASSSTYAIGDTAYPISFGENVGGEYQTITGGQISKYECTIEKDKTIVQTLTVPCIAVSGFTTTYIGTGSYAAAPSGTALKYGDLSSITYDSSGVSSEEAFLDSVKWGIDYSLSPIADLSSSVNSNIGSWAASPRNIYLECEFTPEAMNLAADMLGGTAHTLVFTVGGKTFTFSNIIWEGDWDQTLTKDDVLGMAFKASNVDLAIA